MSRPATVLLGLCVLSLPLALPAQGSGVRLTASDQTVQIDGPDYAARCDLRGVDFVAAPAANAARLRFTLAAVRRAGGANVTLGAAVPELDAERVVFDRGDGVHEVYEPRADGIEQSFVFAERPAGAGDLVVRGLITTDLPLASADDGGVRYERDGSGVAFGAVTGIDANGATVRGSIRAGADWVEWVLPAAFVDGAAYPMVLDPLIGNAFTIGNSVAGADRAPRVAYEASTDRYLVVWTVPISSTVAELHGRIVSGAGGLPAGSFVIEAEVDATVQPDVASVQSTDRFLVAYKRNATISFPPSTDNGDYVRSVSAATAAVSARVPVPAGGLAGRATEMVVGGDRRTGFLTGNDHALLVLRRNPGFLSSSNVIESYRVFVPSAGDPTFAAPQTLVATTDAIGDVAISSHAGTSSGSGRWLVAYGRAASSALPYTFVYGHIVDDSGVPCGLPIPITAGTTSVQRPTVATSTGSHFAVAWQDDATLGLMLRTMTWSGSCGSGTVTLGTVVDPVSAGLDSKPQLEFARDKYVLAWRRVFLIGGSPRVYVKGLDPDSCAACGAEWLAEVTTTSLDEPAVATKWSGGDGTSDGALLVWSNSTIRGRLFEAVGAGTILGVGGACGISGFDDFNTYGGNPVLGSTDFELILANPTTPAVALVVGLSEVSIPCGPCTLVPAIDATVSGSPTVPLSIPCDLSWLGLTFTTQWLILKPGGCSAFPDLALSNALRFTVGE